MMLKTKKYLLPFILFLILFSFLSAGCEKKAEVKTETAEVIPVKVKKVELQTIQKILEYVGNIKARDEIMVYPKVTGKIIEKIKEDGSPIAKGDIIAFVDRDEVGLKFEKAPVESPLAGVVGRVYVDIGSNVNPQTPIALVVDMDKVKIALDLPEKYIPQVSLIQEAKITVDSYPQKIFTGKITKISPVLDLATRTAPIEITIDNLSHELKSGMYARVTLVLEEHKAVPVILKEAIMGRAPGLSVFIVENKKALLKNITTGIQQGPYFEVTEGLKEGDQVVIMGQQKLYDGALVEPEE